MARRSLLISGILAAGLAVTGCGHGSTGSAAHSHGDVLRVIQAAADATSQQNSMRVRGTMKMDLATGSATGPVDATMSGVMQLKPLKADMTLAGMSVAGHSLGTVRMLMTPQAFYMNIPLLAQQLGKPWAEIKFSDMTAASGLDFKQLLSQSQQMQPAQYIQQLAASGDVRSVGTETVDGYTTTHYAGTVSVKEALSHYDSALRAQMQTLMAKAGFTGSRLDVWIDGKGLVRRMHSSTLGGHGSFTIGFDVLDYGVNVHVTPPPANQVADLAQLAQAGSTG